MSTSLVVPGPNVPLNDFSGRRWALATTVQADGSQAIITAPASAGGSAGVVDHSAAIAAGTPLEIPANPDRRYLFIQAQAAGITVYFSVIPLIVPGAGVAGSAYIVPGGSYESGAAVPPGPVAIDVSANAVVTVWEG